MRIRRLLGGLAMAIERFQRCLSRVRMALAMTVMRLGLMRDLREDLPGLEPCHAAFDGCAGCGQGPVPGLFGGGEFAARRAALGGGDPVAGADVGHVGEDRDSLAFSDAEDLVGAGGMPDARPKLRLV